MPQQKEYDGKEIFGEPEQPILEAAKKQKEVEKQKLVSAPPSSLGQDIGKTVETFGSDFSPFYTSPVGTQGPVDQPPQTFEGLVSRAWEGFKGIPGQASSAYDQYKRAMRGELVNPPEGREPDWWDRAYEGGADLIGGVPIFGPPAKAALLAKDTPEMLGHLGALTAMMYGGNPRAMREVPPAMKDVATGFGKGAVEPTQASFGKFHIGVPFPASATYGALGGLTGKQIGEHFQMPLQGGIAGVGLGMVGPPIVGAVRQAKAGFKARGLAMDAAELNKMAQKTYNKPFSKLNPSQKQALKADLWK